MDAATARRVRRDLLRLVLTVGGLGGAIALAWGPVSRLIDPPDDALQTAVAATDVDAVRRLLAGAETKTASRLAYGGYERALRALSPSDARTVEVLRLILQREPQPIRLGLVTGPIPRSANLTFRPARPAGSGPHDTSITPVEIAAQRWSAEGVRALLEHGLDVTSVGAAGAMTAAAANRCLPVITLLLDAGADVNARDRDRDTPLAMARRMKHDDVAALLVSRGARD
jgi:hypothetical protein